MRHVPGPFRGCRSRVPVDGVTRVSRSGDGAFVRDLLACAAERLTRVEVVPLPLYSHTRGLIAPLPDLRQAGTGGSEP